MADEIGPPAKDTLKTPVEFLAMCSCNHGRSVFNRFEAPRAGSRERGMTGRRLEGKVAIVTGAGGGMGRGYALHLASLGADVAILDKDLDVGRRYGEYAERSVADEIRSMGQRAIAVQADLSNRADATAA